MIMSTPNSKKNILLIDDDVSVTRMLRLLLETRGYQVQVAASGRDALEIVTDATDLILLDLILPDQEGLDVCRKLREQKKLRCIPIIILSGKLLSKDIIEGLYVGADDYLTKPFEYEELVARMEAVMRRGGVLGGDGQADDEELIVYKELRSIIDQKSIEAFFQPIFMLNDLSVYGVEALSRPITDSILSNPEILFKAAIRFGCYQDLELVAWKKALEKVTDHLNGRKLFLNCNPYLVEGPKFLTVNNIFEEVRLDKSDVVLEITERSAITNFEIFYEHLCRYRDCGFQFAVDDVGGGYASLESIVETKPEVVKVDRHIVTDIHLDQYKKRV